MEDSKIETPRWFWVVGALFLIWNLIGCSGYLAEHMMSDAAYGKAFGPEKLASVMFTGKDQNVRRIAAGYIGTVAQQGDDDAAKVAKVSISLLTFDSSATAVPWNEGPLFVPGIKWSKEDATGLVGNLIRWNLWCDINGKNQEQQQIHNNIRSLGLARAAGYKSPGWNNADCVTWLKAWGEVAGKAGVEEILREQNVLGNGKYDSALLGLK